MKTRIIILLLATVFFNACSVNIQAWEKELLAKKTMGDTAQNPLISKYEEHIYFSKEATRGGNGVSGGGCGCN